LSLALTESRRRCKERTALDARTRTPEQMQEIEKLYQVGHLHDGHSESIDVAEAIKSHKILLARYPGTNRAGCAVLDLAHLVESEAEDYLHHAITEYSDTYYGNGVSVGASARLDLARRYLAVHREKEAADLIDEIRRDYPDAVADDGGPLAAHLPVLSATK
jgi:hypothetical protein